MNKQTYKIPEGCKAITMEIIDNTIVTTFEPVEPKFKRGDVLIYPEKSTLCVFKQYTQYNEFETYINNTKLGDSFWATECFRHATPEEAQRLWDALAKEGKRWNPETMEVEEIKKELWRAEFNADYYYIDYDTCSIGKSRETKHRYDDARHKFGNYLQTIEQARRALDCMKAALDKFWEEELK